MFPVTNRARPNSRAQWLELIIQMNLWDAGPIFCRSNNGPSDVSPCALSDRRPAFPGTWLLQLLVCSLSLDLHAAVSRHGSYCSTAGTKIDRKFPADPALDRHGKLDVEPAIHSASHEVRRVVFRHVHNNAAIGRADIHLFAIPAIPVKLDYQSAIGSTAVNGASDFSQHHSAV